MKKLALALALLASSTLGSCVLIVGPHCDECEREWDKGEHHAMHCSAPGCTAEHPCADCQAKM